MADKKRIILCTPQNFGIDYQIYKNLLALGFEAVYITFNPNFRYTKKNKIVNFIHKLLLNDYDYKKNLAHKNKHLLDSINAIQGKVDYALILRVDLFPKHIIEAIRQKTNLLIAYQWDNFHIFPEGKRYLSFFDRYYSFDPQDIQKAKHIYPATNFYFDYEEDIPVETAQQVYFLGSLYPEKKNRIEMIMRILRVTNSLQYEPNIIFFTTLSQGLDSYKQQGITFIDRQMSYEENLRNTQKAAVLIDILGGKNKGLSFRFYEALKYRKKLITNNVEVKKYDFYNPHNIFVLENNNEANLPAFLNTPYQEIPENIRQKYSFTNWIHYVLSIDPYTPITVPSK